MASHRREDARRASPSEHPARVAWHRLNPRGLDPTRIDTLQREKKSAVYRLRGVGHDGSAVIAKWCERETGLLERYIYECILPQVPAPMLHFYGFIDDHASAEHGWLFIEDSDGKPYAPEDTEHRVLAARWLGTLHAATVGEAPDATDAPRLESSPGRHLEEIYAVRGSLLQGLTNPFLDRGDKAVLEGILGLTDRVVAKWDQVEAFCARMPQSLVHGDFQEKNARVRLLGRQTALLVFDWEFAGWGTPAADLARFTLDAGHPGLETYWSVMRQSWPLLALQDVHELAGLGGIFALIDAMYWERYGIEYEPWTGRVRAREIAQGSMLNFRIYSGWLSDALRAVGWDA